MIPRGKKGLTLIEVLATVGILSVIIAPLSLLFISGYSNYFIENDDMINIQKSREAMETIMNDLRTHGAFIEVRNGGTELYVRNESGEEFTYTYVSSNKKLLKNGISFYSELDEVTVNTFSAEEIKPDDYDSSLINITLKTVVRRSGEVTLKNSYRKKIP